MAILIFVLFFHILSFVISIQDNESFYSKNIKEKTVSSSLEQSNAKLFAIDLETVIEYLILIRDHPEFAESIIIALKDLLKEKVTEFINEKNLDFLNVIVDDMFNESSSFFPDLIEAIRNNGTIIDHIIDIINYIQSENQTDTIDYILAKVYDILNINETEKIIEFFICPEHNLALFQLIEKYLIPSTKYVYIYNDLKPLIIKYKDSIIRLIYNIFKSYSDNNKILDAAEEFFLENKNSSFLLDLRDIFLQDEVRQNISDLVVLHNKNGEIIKKEILKQKEFVGQFFELINEGDVAVKIFDIIRNYRNFTFILDAVPKFLEYIHDIKPDYYDLILNMAVLVLEKLLREEHFDNFLTEVGTKKLDEFFFGEEFNKYNINQGCKEFFHILFFDNFENFLIGMDEGTKKNLTEMRYFFSKKVLLDSTKNKNDFLTYENCLSKKFDNNLIQGYNFSFTVQPIYIIGLVDDITSKYDFNDSIIQEKYNYLLSYCLPYGKYKDNDTEICKTKDYDNILKIFLDISFNMETAKVSTFSIYETDFRPDEYTFCIISIIIIFIPIIIRIFLYIYKRINFICFKKREKRQYIVALINKEEKDDNKTESNISLKENIKKRFKLNYPKWYKYLSEYFSIIKNGSLLFDSKESIYNNVNGITYIKGLLGISMIFYIFGHTYLALFNLPFKVFTLSGFQDLIQNPFLVIPLIGLRYSPRVILSCSGYTLIYKFLCFIEKEPKYYLPKFFLLQSYKYILLIMVVVFTRYMMYYINIIIYQKKRPKLEILNKFLEYDSDDSFKLFFSFLIGYLGDLSFPKKQHLIQFFYLPLNEVFFFVICTIFISVGYKCRIRIDIIIIILVIMIFLAKILIYIFLMYDHKIYSTLYFYLYDYGAIMLNPIYNMPSFLIGMFFGLVNYSIQRGVSLSKNNSYQRISQETNRDGEYSLNESIQDKNQDFTKTKTIINPNDDFLYEGLGLDDLDSVNNNNIYYQQQNDKKRSLSQIIPKDKNNLINFSKTKKTITSNITGSISFYNKNTFYIEDSSLKIVDMPFLTWPYKFFSFHRKNEGEWYFKLIITFSILFIISFSCAHFVFVGIIRYENDNDNTNKDKDIIKQFSFEKVFTNYFLNIIYVIDIDLVIFMINWVLFIIYSKGYKSTEIYDFFNKGFWDFFLKCYFSFIIISSEIILYYFYQSETVINFTLTNVYLFSFIFWILIFLFVVVFYSFYEMPLKKIFKSFLKKDKILKEYSENNDDDYYED